MACVGSLNCNPNLDKSVSFYRDSVVVRDGGRTVATIDLCDINIGFQSFCNSRVSLPPGEEYVLDCCGAGVSANFLVIKVNYQDPANVYRNIIISPGFSPDPNSLRADQAMQYFVLDEFGSDTAYPLQNLLVLSGEPVPKIRIVNTSGVTGDLQFIVTSNRNIPNPEVVPYIPPLSGNKVIENLNYSSLVSSSNDTILIQNNENRAELMLNLDYLQHFEASGRFIIIDEQSQGKIYLGFTDESVVAQIISVLNYTLNNRVRHNQSGLQGFKLPLFPMDLEGPDIKPNTRLLTLTSDNRYHCEMLLGSFNGLNPIANQISKQNIIENLILSIVDNRDGEIAKQANYVTITDTSNQQSLTVINYPGVYHVAIQVSDLAGNISHLDINFIINQD